jgi:hypothetical protein
MSKIYIRVPWHLKDIAAEHGGRWNAERRETEFDADTDLTELLDAIEVYYEMHPRVRRGAGRPMAGAGFTLVEIPFSAPGAAEAREFIKAQGGTFDGKTKQWLVPDAEVERVKGMVELPPITWRAS